MIQIKNSKTALLHPTIDFFMLGGLSLLVPIALLFLPAGILDKHAHTIGWSAFYASFLINYPHFAHSYQLLYGDLFKKLKDTAVSRLNKYRYINAAFVVPALMIVYCIWAVQQNSLPLLGYMVNALFFFVGWHYVKQGYGVLMVFSAMNKVYFSQKEKFLLLGHAYAVWLYTWIRSNVGTFEVFWGKVPYNGLGFPQELADVFFYTMYALSALVALMLVYKIYREKTLPPVSGLIGYFSALYLWLVFAYDNVIFTFFVPAFHALQYLLFVWKLQHEKYKQGNANKKTQRYYLQFGLFLGFGGLLGAAGFHWIPEGIDSFLQTHNQVLVTPALFSFIFTMFINIHHYFIDSAIWRKDNPDLAQYLIKPSLKE